jgi:hypothetical protein
MQTPTLHRASRFSRLVGLGLALASVVAMAEGDEWSKLRLSGVVLAGESELAVIQHRNGAGWFARRGDQLPGIGTVSKIAPMWIRLETPEGPRLLYLNSPPGEGAPPSAPEPAKVAEVVPPAEGHRMGDSVTATLEILKAIARLAAKPGASNAELSLVLIPLLDLPRDAQISSFFPGDPEREAKGPAEVNATLTRGEPLRLRIEAGGQQQMIYLMPGLPGGAGPNNDTH